MRKLSLDDAEILRLRRAGMTYKAIGEMYGTSKQTIERRCRSELRKERFFGERREDHDRTE